MSFGISTQKENSLRAPTTTTHADSPFSAFMTSPLKFDKPQQPSNATTKAKTTQSLHGQNQTASRAPLSPLTTSALNAGPVGRAVSHKSLSRPTTPNSKAVLDDSKVSPSSAALRSASEDIFAAFISSPVHKTKPATETATTTSHELKSAKLGTITSPAAYSPKPQRSSVCFDALSRAMSREFNAEELKQAKASVAGKLDFSGTTASRDSSAMDVDVTIPSVTPVIFRSASINEIEAEDATQVQKRSVGNSPILKEVPVSTKPSMTPTKSKRSLKHQRQHSIKSKRDKVEFSSNVSVAASAPATDGSRTPPKTDESGTPVRTKGSPSRLAKQRLISRPSYKTRAGISVPSSNIRADQLRSSMEVDSSQLKAFMAAQEPQANVRTTMITPAPSTPVAQARTLSAIIGSPDDPLGASARKRAASEAAPSTKNRNQSLDEAYLSFAGGVVNGKRYDVYGFEESSIRAPVDAESVLKINETQERFWTHWLQTMSGNKSEVSTTDAQITSKGSRSDLSQSDDASTPFLSVHPHTDPLAVPVPSPILQSMVYAGVPHYLRGRAWAHLIGLRAYRESHSPQPGFYGELRSRGKHTKWGNQIDLDLPRTFCGHLLFREKGEISSEFGKSWSNFGENSSENGNDSKFAGVPRGQKLLSHVLNAYAFYNEKVGYCQGMSFLAAMLLMVMEGEEEKVFWSLCAIMDSQGGRLVSYYEPGMAGVLEDVNILRKLILLEMPQLYQHFEKVGVDASFFATRWFLSFFTDMSHWSSVLRLWDLYMLQGHFALFRFALAILKANLTDLLSLKSCETLFPFLLNLPYNNLTPSLLLAVYRTIDINYLYGEVTSPDAEAKYSTSHIHQSLPPLTSKSAANKKKTSAGTGSSSSGRGERQEKYQKTLSKKQLQRLASRKKMNEALLDSNMASSTAGSGSSAGMNSSKSDLPTTPMPRKTRPTSMMVFASSSSAAGQEEEDSTPKKSFFGRMWDKLKSPALGSSSSSATKAKPQTVDPKTPRPNEVTFAASPSSPSARQFASKTSGSISIASTPNMASPSRTKSKKSMHTQTAVSGAHSSLATPGKTSVDAKTIDECDKLLKERITSPKRRREGDETSEDVSASLSKTKSKKRIISWFASDTSAEATTWDGVKDEKSQGRDRSASVTMAAKEAEQQSLFMDEDERQAFIEFATSTPIRGIANSQQRSGNPIPTTPRPDSKYASIGKDSGANSATPRPARSGSSNHQSSADVPTMRLPPPPGDVKAHHRGAGDTPKVGGGPMHAPQFATTPRPVNASGASTASQKKSVASSSTASSQKGVLSPIEMDTSWIRRH